MMEIVIGVLCYVSGLAFGFSVGLYFTWQRLTTAARVAAMTNDMATAFRNNIARLEQYETYINEREKRLKESEDTRWN